MRSGRALVRDGQPRYRQLADDLRSRILYQEFVVGGAIPTEAQLSREYRASRITVRHALDLLEQEGLLHREQGRGSFVRARAISIGPRRLTSFSEELAERGLRHSSDLVGVLVVRARDEIPIDLRGHEDCARIERVRRADGRAIAHQVTYLPIDFTEGIEDALGDSGSMYAFLRSRHALDIDSADETYRVAGADEHAAAILGVPIGSPVFVVERVGFAGNDRVEWTLSTVAGDGYEVHVHLRR
jgi:GntR family transcriptional regulator